MLFRSKKRFKMRDGNWDTLDLKSVHETVGSLGQPKTPPIIKGFLVGKFKLIFSVLNNLIQIFIYFFTHMYLKKLQTTLFKLLYQTNPKTSLLRNCHVVLNLN